jgi:hypothetical protein
MEVMARSLEFFRPQQCVDQIDEEEERGNSGDDVIHGWGSPLQLVARLGEGPGDDEEKNRDDHVEDVEHNVLISL